MASKCRVALIGTGAMGCAMAGRLLGAGFDLVVFDRDPQRCAPLVAAGARLAQGIGQAVADADVVVTMLGAPEEVEDLYLRRDGLVDACRPGAYLIDMTTTSSELARDIAEYAQMSGRHAFDAPVTGTPDEAHAGTLTVLCGATAAEVGPVRAVLDCLARRVCCFGGPGKGQIAKLAHRAALAGALTGLAECLALAKQGGLDLADVLGSLEGGLGDSGAMAAWGPKVAAGDFACGLTVDRCARDLGLVLGEAEGLELTLPGVECAAELLGVLSDLGAGALGAQAVSLAYEDEATCERNGLSWSSLDEGADDGAPCGCGHDHGHGAPCGCDTDDDDDEYEEYDLAQVYGLESLYDPSQN